MADEFASALTSFDACCAAYPKEPESLFRRGVVQLMLGKNHAREALQQAHAIHPGCKESCALQTQGYQ